MRVSIVTPSFNQAEFIEQTIQSVLSQDYPNIEYIIVDGGSTDGSLEIIEKYANRLAWWVSEPDRGQAEAINKGMAHATGDVVAWLNSDDLYARGAVSQAVAALQANPAAGMVYGDAVSIDRKGRPFNEQKFADWGLEGLAAFNIICQPAVFVRRDAWQRAGGLDESYHLLLDHHLWLRIASQTKTLHVPRVWAFARHHPAAKNVALAEKFGEEAYRIVEWMSTYPGTRAVVACHSRQVWAAAHRFNARYLLDGGQSWAALRGYLQSLFIHPPTALREWHRILFAGLSVIGLGGLGRVYYRVKRRRFV